MKQVAKKAFGAVSSKGAGHAVEALRMLIKAQSDYAQTREVEQTKRADIAQDGAVELARLQSQREMLRDYLHATFAERKTIIDGSFARLDKAIEAGNTELAMQLLGTVIAVAKESPLAHVKSAMQAMSDRRVDVIDI